MRSSHKTAFRLAGPGLCYHEADNDNAMNARHQGGNGEAMSIITDGGDVAVCRLRKSGYILYQTIMSVVFAVVMFALCALVILAADAKGVVKTVNSLLGASLGTITAGRLIALAGVFALVVGVGRIIIHACLAFIKDAALMMSGGIVVAAAPSATGKAASTDPPAPRTARTASSTASPKEPAQAYSLDSDPVEGMVSMPSASR